MQRNKIIKIANIRKHLPRTSKEYPQYLLRIRDFATKLTIPKDLFQKFTKFAIRIDSLTDRIILKCKETGSLKLSTL
jgi:hypothetical protein